MPAPHPASLTDAVAERVAAGKSLTQIGDALGLSRSAVGGVIHRLRKAGDPRIPAAGPGPIVTKAQKRAALADAFADGAPTLDAAARDAALSPARAKAIWADIRHRLGWQAS